eukprot:8782551-Lingulodinium_polyedra.AAC.1
MPSNRPSTVGTPWKRHARALRAPAISAARTGRANARFAAAGRWTWLGCRAGDASALLARCS